MTQPTGTFSSYDAVGNREDLSDIIYDISPIDTPILSMIPKVKATNRVHEWQTDVLDQCSAANAAVEGDDAAGSTLTATVRPNNVCQIFTKVPIVTGTQESIEHAGRSSEINYQLAKEMKAIKRDMEGSITANVAKVTGDDTTARRMGGLAAWIGSNDAFATGSSGGSPASPVGADGTAARTDASTKAAFQEADFKTALALCYNAGADPTYVVLSGINKQVFSSFSGGMTRFDSAEDARLIATVDIYRSDFGTLAIIPDRWLGGASAANVPVRGRDVWILDPTMLALAELRPLFMQDLAVSGDSIKKQLLWEATLEVRNEKAHGLVADTTG